jgi:tetratricopeptide (TPR) repeat protein
MKNWQIGMTAGTFAALVLISGSVLGAAGAATPDALASKGALSLPNDAATLLDDCKDDEIIGAERQSLCTELIGNTQLPPAVRAEALVHRGIVMLDDGHVNLAMADFEAAIVLNPGDPVAHAYRGEVLKARGQLKDALAAYDMAIDLDGNSADLLANRGDLHRQLGARDKAREDFEAALKIEQDHDTAMAGLKALTKAARRK